jgi:hypothetical protein
MSIRAGFFRWFTLCVAVGLVADHARSESSHAAASMPTTIAGVPVTAPEPSMPSGLDAKMQASVLRELAGKYPLDRFTKASIVAPFTLKRNTIKNSEGERIGHQVDLWFVAHGRLDAIGEENLFLAMVESKDSDEAGAGQPITDEELSARGLKASSVEANGTNSRLAYYQFSAPVLDRVIVEGVVRRFSSANQDSYLASITLEDAFRGDTEYPNRWRHSSEDVADAVSYGGFGGYAKATRLLGYEDAILVECHAVLHEPQAWFSGANLLSSKLPLVAQNTVRKFRRALAKH